VVGLQNNIQNLYTLYLAIVMVK